MTVPPTYVLNEAVMDAMCRGFVLVRDWSADDWTRVYLDPETGETWMRYQPFGYMQAGGPHLFRRGAMPDERVGWAAALLRSGNDADAIGADLSLEPEVWPALLDRLTVLLPGNRYPFLHRENWEIEADAEHFRVLARRASLLVT